MIVKTGANYQADGGYIEASRDGNIITIGNGVTSSQIIGDTPYGGFISIHIINQSSRELRFNQLTNAPSVGEYLGEPANNIPGGGEANIKVPAYIGVKQRVTYTGLRINNWKSDADTSKIVVESSPDGILTIALTETATDGMTVNLYVEGE